MYMYIFLIKIYDIKINNSIRKINLIFDITIIIVFKKMEF